MVNSGDDYFSRHGIYQPYQHPKCLVIGVVGHVPISKIDEFKKILGEIDFLRIVILKSSMEKLWITGDCFEDD